MFSFSAGTACFAQVAGRDTIRPDLATVEGSFLKNNYDLLLKKYDIASSKAELITAKLFSNPEISYENVFYNPSSKKFFQTSSADEQGQFTAQYSQLIRLAGKRNKSIRLATAGIKLSEYEFYDLLRTLRYTLRSTFYSLYYLQQSAKAYTGEIASLQKTLDVFNDQYSKGNIARKEVIRIKSLLYVLQSELSTLQNEIEDKQSDLKLMTGIDPVVVIEPVGVAAGMEKPLAARIPYQQLIDSALANRPDLKAARTGIEMAEVNLDLQKANAVPDLTLSGMYDLQGSHVKYYTGIGVSVALPLFNRNQGAVRQAKIDVDVSQMFVQSKEAQIKNEVMNTYRSLSRLDEVYNGMDQSFSDDFGKLIAEVDSNYRKRNISLLEFIDFYNSYRENAVQLNQLRAQRMLSMEELNYVTATDIGY